MTGFDAHARNPATTWAALAAEAGADVNTRFGHRLMGIPGTWIGALEAGAAEDPNAQRPSGRRRQTDTRQRPWSQWHYWWQSHYLDSIIDAAFQALSQADRITARAALRRARQLLRGILIRNFGVFPNYYFDDMAWLALAAGRLNALSVRLEARNPPLALHAVNTLTKQLHGAHDSVLGGGIYWSRKRDFKNTPANGPAALHFARMGELDTAAAIVGWLRAELFNPETGLYLDGIHPSTTGRDVESTVYTYNQGPILAALLRLGRPQDLADATALIEAVGQGLHTPGQGLRLEPGGDGSLFTGILCRYLAIAAQDPRLPARSRETASTMVLETAARLGGEPPAQLSAAIQRWTVLSAAASL
ncbi:hypothetical protein MB46_18400 [Arthrobacter alpinus]|uniref:glycoside hydrolase family 76 protein n=1 Tax=Arthrobacter alpinus TaxID=656366 RepID=UPI0005CA27AA|nr:glycoside hydrolase family 76 protein [Arthrobacter alpinus]ALV47166.1 hypothetical protein MB46_18400 [Arthrobacter alpinus]